MSPAPSLNSLRSFESCARLGSVKKAAAELHVTPSAVSHQLKSLEAHLGVELLQRSVRKIEVTELGRQLQHDLTKAFGFIQDATAKVRQYQLDEVVSINVLPVFSINWLSARLGLFFQANPSIELRIVNSYRVEDINRGGNDLAIRWGNGEWSGGTSEKLMNESVIPVCHPRIANSMCERNGLEMLKQSLIEMYISQNHWSSWAKRFDLEIPKNTRRLRYNDPVAAIQAAKDGLGIVLAPLALVYDNVVTGSLVAPLPESIPVENSYYLVSPNQELLEKPHVGLFVKWLKGEIETYCDAIHGMKYDGKRR
mgnify:CR=1 FL=1